MTPEEVAERYHDRSGFRLIDYREVALPMYSVATRLLTLARKPVAVIEEFCLRAVAAGLSDPQMVADFYGLDPRVVNGALAGLAGSDDVALTASDTSRRHVLRLTAKGTATLANLVSIVPEERVVDIPFDAILRRVREPGGVPTLAPREVRAAGVFSIPPTEVRKPQLADITPETVENLLKRIMGDSEAAREVLAVKELVRSERRFVPAVALLFESESGGDYQLAFAIDGILSPEHESAFARAGGVARLHVDEHVRRSKQERDEELAREVAKAAPALTTDRDLRRQTAQKKAEIRTLREQLRVQEDGGRVAELEARVRELEGQLSAVENRQTELKTRFLYCYDHAPLLRQALDTAKTRVMIISPWIKSEVLDDELRNAIVKLLERGVTLYIGWGYPNENDRPSISAGALRFLDSLAKRYPNFHFKEFGNTHAKVLLVDSSFVVHTSFNWLSFRGDPERTFRDEQGVMNSDPAVVEQKFQELIPRF